MKHVIVFWVEMYLVRPGFFLHLPNKAIKQPKKAMISHGKGKMPMSSMVVAIQAVFSELYLYPPGHAPRQIPSWRTNGELHLKHFSMFESSQISHPA